MQRKIWLILLLWLFGVTEAVAEARIALVIGNGDYQAVGKLPNPTNDATLMAETLGAIGFEVTLVTDGSYQDMRAAISGFGARLREGGKDAVGLFYYAGHGVQSFGRNYLLPTDASLTNAADLSLVAIEADSVLQQLRSAGNRTNIVILDACRNNPFKAVLDLDENGLAEMNAPPGTYLAYATGPGQTAVDGRGDHSPFTFALAREIPTPGRPLEEVFKEVRRYVVAETGTLQTPWDTSSLSVDFYFVPAKVMTPEEKAEDQLWQAVTTASDPMQVSLFLKAYPDSPHAPEARALLKTLLELLVAPETTPPTNEPPPGPGTDELAAFDAAMAAASREAYEGFIAQYPASILVEAVNIELAALPPADPAEPQIEKGLQISPSQPDAPMDPVLYEQAGITFSTPLTLGSPEIVGRTLEQLIAEGTPLYPPFAELPEEVWKGKKCTTCHEWNRAILCDQGKVMLLQDSAAAQHSLAQPHPLGIPFKLTLRAWAKADCP